MEFLDTGAEDYLEDSGLSVIEWADIVADVLPPDALVVMIEYAEEGKRKVTVL
jgi:tRNA threonylcarbamoyladenosine biosynthesis protein TsaE